MTGDELLHERIKTAVAHPHVARAAEIGRAIRAHQNFLYFGQLALLVNYFKRGLRRKFFYQLGKEVSLFVGVSAGKNAGQRLARTKPLVNCLQRGLPIGRYQTAFLADHRRGQALAAGEIVKAVTSFVAEPMAVHSFVNARLKTRDSILIGLDADVTARAAARANRRRLLQIPNSDFETEIAIGQRADRANVDDVGRQRIVELLFRE